MANINVGWLVHWLDENKCVLYNVAKWRIFYQFIDGKKEKAKQCS